jgi:hypothetical protein
MKRAADNAGCSVVSEVRQGRGFVIQPTGTGSERDDLLRKWLCRPSVGLLEEWEYIQ